jgi:D-cysteine desulfhydrase family pyridoxal phosphate-dependent enzyme
MRLDQMPRVSLSPFPTPLQEAPRLARRLGLRRLLIKRDDCTTLGMGGNKVRKLEFLMADALACGADVILTDGGPQSNHARLTAAAARAVGIDDCRLFLAGPPFERLDGNLLLDALFGARVTFIENGSIRDMDTAMRDEAAALESEGRHPYVIPLGGSTPVGALGYVNAMRELSQQLDEGDKNALIFTAVGSAGTCAGCVLGTGLFLPEAQVLGVTVGSGSKVLARYSASIATGSAELLGRPETFTPEDFTILDGYVGARYGIPSEAGNEAVVATARDEGLVLDPIYTGKAMSGLFDQAKRGLIDKDRTIIFLHTGGSPALFAHEESFREYARFDEATREELGFG